MCTPLNYLKERIEYTTITITLMEAEQQTPPPPMITIPVLDWGRALEIGLRGVFIILSGLIVLVMVGAPLALITTPIYVIAKRRLRKKPSEKPPTTS